MNTVIRNATLVNEWKISVRDVFIANSRIENISAQINLPANLGYSEIDAEGLYLMPGAIDDQVHFREPGQIHKADIFSGSKAAVAGGITSFMDMPNIIPHVLTQELLQEKYEMASRKSLANYFFSWALIRITWKKP